ncbi:unnamed protein product [Sphagnum balticum]
MGLLFTRILLHEAHEEDKQYRGGGNADDDGDKHDDAAEYSAHNDITELKSVESAKFDRIETREAIRTTAVVELAVDEKFEEVNSSE